MRCEKLNTPPELSEFVWRAACAVARNIESTPLQVLSGGKQRIGSLGRAGLVAVLRRCLWFREATSRRPMTVWVCFDGQPEPGYSEPSYPKLGALLGHDHTSVLYISKKPSGALIADAVIEGLRAYAPVGPMECGVIQTPDRLKVMPADPWSVRLPIGRHAGQTIREAMDRPGGRSFIEYMVRECMGGRVFLGAARTVLQQCTEAGNGVLATG